MVARNNPNEIYITRVYQAPLQAVWNAWTDPDQVAQWWGPRGFTLTTHSKELKPGGIWHYTMHGPDGVDYPNKTLYHVVEEYKKLVYDHGAYDERDPLFRVTVVFSESEGATTMEMTMALPTAEQAEATRKFIKAVGGNATWDRLAEFLNEREKDQPSFVINRSFAAPVDQLFQLWIEPDHVSKRLLLAGFEMEIRQADIREGGSCFFRMSNQAGVAFFGQWKYENIHKPRRIVYFQRFCDEQGNLAHHPGLPVFPEALRTTVEFVPEDEHSTRITVTFEPSGTVSAEELQAFLNARPGMTLGWTGSFDKLETIMADTAKT